MELFLRGAAGMVFHQSPERHARTLSIGPDSADALRARRAMAAAAIALIATLLYCGAGTAAAPDGILIIHSNQRPTLAAIVIEDTMRKAVPELLKRPVEIYSEYLDIERTPMEGYADAQAEFLRMKYAGRNIRVIVAAAPDAVRFAIGTRDRMLPGVPVVHIALPRDQLQRMALPPDVVGRTVDLDPSATLDLALRLHPDAQRLVIVLGAAERDRAWERRIRDAVTRLRRPLEVEYLSGLANSEVQRRLGALPRTAVVFTPGYFLDGAGNVTIPRQSVDLIAAASVAPVYGPLDTYVGAGIVGGYVAPYEEQTKEAAAIAVRLLSGTAPADIAPTPMVNVPMVDWRQLRRFGIDERLLPSDTIVRFREPTAWDKYGGEISAGIAIVILQAALIAALLLERRSGRRTSAALEEAQKQMSLAARAAGLSLWIWDAAHDRIAATTHSWRHADPRRQEPVAFADVLKAAHPADRDELKHAAEAALATGSELDVEYRVVEPDGGVRWIAARGRAEGGKDRRLFGVALDVTERKAAELRETQDRDALRHMTRVSMMGQLSAAIAHQLNQPLAAILGNAEAAQKMLGRENVDLEELRAICRDIVGEDQRAADIIRQLSALYRRGGIRTGPLYLNTLIRETLDLLRAELLTRQIVPTIDLAPDLPLVEGEHVQLQQVLLNLVLNAADALGDVDAGGRRLEIRTRRDGGEVQLFVVDNGSGIPTEALDRLFDPFWTNKEGGTGMGLAICKSIVSAHHGAIAAWNNPGGGATFRVSLPVRKGP
jgi:signal transduction histidine kinase